MQCISSNMCPPPNTQNTLCEVINATAIKCVTPPLHVNRIPPGDIDGIGYSIQVDGADGPDPSANVSLQISVRPNPGNFRLVDTEYNAGGNTVIRIAVRTVITMPYSL